MKKHVITGGPGVGKTTTLEALAARGFEIVPEAARMVIAEQQPNGLLPWTDLRGFQWLVYLRQCQLESRIKGPIAFLDRGKYDAVAYCKQGNVAIPEYLTNQGEYGKVFLLDRLPFYQTDAQRKEDAIVAAQLHEMIGQAYLDYGYDVIKVPAVPVAQRVDYILTRLK